jgi:hypothetical protein
LGGSDADCRGRVVGVARRSVGLTQGVGGKTKLSTLVFHTVVLHWAQSFGVQFFGPVRFEMAVPLRREVTPEMQGTGGTSRAVSL